MYNVSPFRLVEAGVGSEAVVFVDDALSVVVGLLSTFVVGNPILDGMLVLVVEVCRAASPSLPLNDAVEMAEAVSEILS